ncbi:MAG: choice-of-anchor D domain-containing protein [bacterium]
MKSILTVMISAVLCSSAFAQIAQGPATGSVPGGVIVTTDSFDDIARPAGEGPVAKLFHNKVNPPLLPPPANMPPPFAPEGSNYFEDPSVRRDAPPAPPPITVASFQGNNQTSGFPPDPVMAVGPNHIMHLVNSSFRISDKNGVTIKTINADSWYSSTLSNPGAFDPKVFYDTHANRWVMVWDNQNATTQTAYFLVSVSDDDNPLGVWFNWALPSNVNGSTPTNTWQDYEAAGFDSRAYYITGRHFGFSTGYFGNAVRVIPKAQLIGATPGAVTWSDFWGLRDSFGNDVDGVRPSFVYTNPNEYYLLGPPSLTSASYFALYRITNVLTTPAISCVHVPVTAFSNAPNAGQLGGGTGIEAGGSRIRHEVIYRDSSLWAAHAINNGGYSAVHYVRINTPTNTVSEDASFGATGFWYFYPSLVVDKDNNIGITFTRSGDTEYAGAYFTWRLNSDPPGLRPSETIRPGAGNYVVLGSGRNRWGDYMGAGIDPADKSNLWFLTEYAAGTNASAVWVHGTRFVPYVGARVTTNISSRDFGRVEVGKSSDSMEVKISNIGSTNLVVSNITKSQSAYTMLNLPTFPKTLTSFDSVKIKIYFRPTAQGIVSDTLRVSTNDANTPEYKIALTAKGVIIGRATAGVIYAASGPPSTSSLYTINPTTGVATTIGGTGLTEVQGLTIHPVTRELYGVFANATSTDLYRISAPYGDALPAKTLPLGNARAVAFANDGSLFAGTNTGRLYRINITTGDTTYLGTAAGIVYSGLTLNPRTGLLWASVRPPITGRDRIYTVNPVDGDTTYVGSSGGGNITPYLAFDAAGKLYGLKGTSTQIDTLIVVDTTTAFGTRIGSLGVAGVNALAVRTDSAATLGVSEIPGKLPQTFVLEQNYPNPFNPSTKIRFSIPAGSSKPIVSLRIYDIVGREVAVLVNKEMEAGSYEATFDAAKLASGTYLYKLQAGSFVETKKMLLMK